MMQRPTGFTGESSTDLRYSLTQTASRHQKGLWWAELVWRIEQRKKR